MYNLCVIGCTAVVLTLFQGEGELHTTQYPVLVAGPVQSGGGLVVALHNGPQDGSHVLDWGLHTLQDELASQQGAAAGLVGGEGGTENV